MSLEDQLKEVVSNSARKIAALEDENEQLRRTVDFHEKFGVSERKEKAHAILAAMIQSQHPGPRQDLNVKLWVKKAYEIADALESEGGKP
jgi:hypothetical protein